MSFLNWAGEHPWFALFMVLVGVSVLRGFANFILRLCKRDELS